MIGVFVGFLCIPLNAELNPICHLLALLGGATIVVVSRLRVNASFTYQITNGKCQSDDVLISGHAFGASPQSPASLAPTFFAAELLFLDEWKVSALRSCVVCSCALKLHCLSCLP